jgi:hypothetical protein
MHSTSFTSNEHGDSRGLTKLARPPFALTARLDSESYSSTDATPRAGADIAAYDMAQHPMLDLGLAIELDGSASSSASASASAAADADARRRNTLHLPRPRHATRHSPHHPAPYPALGRHAMRRTLSLVLWVVLGMFVSLVVFGGGGGRGAIVDVSSASASAFAAQGRGGGSRSAAFAGYVADESMYAAVRGAKGEWDRWAVAGAMADGDVAGGLVSGWGGVVG